MRRTLFVLAAALGATFSGPALADHLNIKVEGLTVNGADVTFPSVLIDKDGFIVLHEVQNGDIVLPQSIGHAAVSAGTTENVTVTPTSPLKKAASTTP
jgi:hypothetical protein